MANSGIIIAPFYSGLLLIVSGCRIRNESSDRPRGKNGRLAKSIGSSIRPMGLENPALLLTKSKSCDR